MTFLQWLRDKFHLDPHLSQSQVYREFLKGASKLAGKGDVSIYKGGYRTLESVLFDPENYVFIVVVHGKRINKPRALKEWFINYKT